MRQINQQDDELFIQLRQFLSEKTGNHEEEIFQDSHLQEDLGINLMEDFPRLLVHINSEFQINLNIDEVLDELEEAGETVGELVKLIKDEVELG